MKRLILLLSVSLLVLSCSSAPSGGDTTGGGGGTPSPWPAGIYVSTTGSDANAGTDKAAPVLTIQIAIMKAVSNGLANVYVAEGLYTNGFGLLPWTNSDGSTNSGVHVSNHNLALYGGCDAGTFDPQSGHYSVLNRSNKPDHVIEIKDATNLRLSGFVVMGGYASGPDPASPTGGGIFMTNSHYCAISNCVMTNNRGWNGGGLGMLHSSQNLIHATFTTNIYGGLGGGIYMGAGANRNYLAVIIMNCAAPNGGGGIYMVDANTNLITGQITGNSCNADGGGIAMIYGKDNVFSNCVFTANRTESMVGGGLALYDLRAIVLNCVFSNNFAAQKGGGVFIFNPDCVVSNSVFLNNTVSNNTQHTYGGALYIQGFNTTVFNCQFANNLSVATSGYTAYGGAIHAQSTPTGIKIRNCVISNNTAYYGGGIANLLTGAGNFLTVESNFITCNRAGYMGGGLYSSGGPGFRIVQNVITSNAATVGCGMYMHGWALVQSNLIATNKPLGMFGSAIYYSNYPTTNIHNVILGDNSAIGLDYCHMATTIFTSNIIGGSSIGNTGYAIYENSADTYNHRLTYNLFLTNTLSYLYQDFENGWETNITSGADWNNINNTAYTGASTAANNGVTNL